MAIVISNHRIVNVPQRNSPNHGANFDKGLPDTLIIHFTGGSSAESSVSWLCNPQAKASAHVVIGRDGAITQLVPFDVIAWHAGASAYGGRTGFNRYAIGIELDNPGRLSRTQSGGYIADFGRSYPAEQVISAVHRNEKVASFWLTYAEPQLAAAFDLGAALCNVYPIQHILGHEEIAPGRKIDPGPAFPLDRFRQLILGRDRSAVDGIGSPQPDARTIEAPGPVPSPAPAAQPLSAYVNADWLNVRLAPRLDAPLAAPPLRRGTMVEVLDRQSGWLQIKAGIVGWSKAAYLRMP
jgi:N-acetylmuramoyl-L-alanine amidase